MLQFDCRTNTWIIFSNTNKTILEDDELERLRVNPNTCELIHPAAKKEKASVDEQLDDIKNMEGEYFDKGQVWKHLVLNLFSLMVSASFLASYNPTTFYTGIMYVVFSPLRAIFIFGSWTGFIYECTSPDAIIKVIEACYIFRHEENLVEEEEAYRMI